MKKMYYQEMLPYELEKILETRPVAFLPLGTLEYHGPHLPVGNDAIKSEGICERVCKRTGGVIVPTLYWGIGGGHKNYPASIIIRDKILSELLTDILEGLYRVGFRIYIILTGHYPAEQVEVVKKASYKFRKNHKNVFIWALPEFEAFTNKSCRDHAAKWETSILMYLYPKLVDMRKLIGANSPDAPDNTRNIDEMNIPGPLYGILGENPAKYASKKLGKETVDTIVNNIAYWVNKSLKKLRYD